MKTDAGKKTAQAMNEPLIVSTYVTMTDVMTSLSDERTRCVTRRSNGKKMTKMITCRRTQLAATADIYTPVSLCGFHILSIALMQKALILEAKQGRFIVGQRPIPTPGVGQLLVKVYSTALNPIDWKIQQTGVFVDKYPAVVGTDMAGEVAEVGQGVVNFTKGQRV